MKAVVVYFSLSGHTKFAAEAVAAKLGAATLKLEPKRAYPRGRALQMIAGGFEAAFGRARGLKPYKFEREKRDLIVLATPVWAGKLSPPMKRFLAENDLGDTPVGLVACCGGGSTKICMDMFRAHAQNVVAELSLVDPSAKSEVQTKAAIAEFCGKLKAKHDV